MPLTEEKVLTQGRARYRIAHDHALPWRKEGKECFDIVAGHQISEEDKRQLERDKRPAVVFNMIGPNIKAITGMERGNRHEIKYLPRERGEQDATASEVYNEVSSWVNDRNDSEYHESKAFRDMTICGMGWTQLRVDTDEDEQGKINTPTIDPLRKLWDPSAKEENLMDRRYDFTEVTMDREEFDDLFPNFEEAPSQTVFDKSFEDDFEIEVLKEHQPDQYAQGSSDSESMKVVQKVTVLEYNFFIRERIYRVVDEQGQPQEFAGEDKANKLAEAGFEVQDLGKKRRYYRAWFNGEHLIEQQPSADKTSFTEHCITGEFDRNKGHWFGVVRAMKDPQIWGNKLFMQLLHIINSNAKGGFFFKSGVFKNKVKALRDWARGDRGIELDGDPNTDIRERAPTPMPQAMHELLMFVTGIIPRVSGFNMELLGLAGKDQPGVLENMRKQAGMTILSPFFDSLRFYRRAKGRTLRNFIRTYMSPERVARIVSEELAPQSSIIFDPAVGQFDVVVEEAPQSPNVKASNFMMLMEMVQTNPELGTSIVDLIVKESPLPISLSNEIAKRFAQAQQPDPMVEALRKAELSETEATALLKHMQALLAQAKTGTELEKTQLEQDKIDAGLTSDIIEGNQTMLQVAAQMQQANKKDSNG